ncbi:MAG: hypothetical protein COA79_21675 [Planctomycetota bacterium]|nr:MAG: hypothetical protein COA79_21675 [Planctomycetota bacterium]
MFQNHWLPNYMPQTQSIATGEYENYTGVWRSYFENGNLAYRGEFIYGKQVGKHVSWRDNGVKMTERVYKDGAIVSMVEWDESGKLK